MKIGIIGVGMMGSAFYKGIIQAFDPKDIFLCDKDVSKLFDYDKSNSTTHVETILPQCDIIILSIKPQSLDALAKSINYSLKDKLVISIMAGISINHLREKLGAEKIVRSMPNLPVEIEKGIIGWIATKNVTRQEKDLVKIIFDPLGEQIELKDESKIDLITALSGSGPAYFFYLAELLAQKAKKVGFSTKEAMLIAEQTLIGSGCLLGKNKSLSVKEWRDAVTSKGGTTEAAINFLKKSEFPVLFEEAIEEAVVRSKELNQ